MYTAVHACILLYMRVFRTAFIGYILTWEALDLRPQ
jgi:hypothetical protein